MHLPALLTDRFSFASITNLAEQLRLRSILLLTLVLAGCSGPDAAIPAGSRGELHEEIRIGGSELELVPIRRVAVSSRGDIAIGQELEGKIIITDSGGTVLALVGSHGEGPGEFLGTPIFDWIGDSLFAGTNRLTVFSRMGRLIRTQPWNRELTLNQNGVAYHPFMVGEILLGILSGARRVEFSMADPLYGTRPIGFDSTPRAMALTVVDTAGDIAGIFGSSSATVPVGCRGAYCPRPLASVAAQQGLLLAAVPVNPKPDSISYEIALIGIDNSDTLYSATRSYPREAIPPAVLDSLSTPDKSQPVRVDVAEYIGGPARTRSVRGSAQATPGDPRQPTTYPGLLQVLVGSDSTIWLEHMPSRTWEAMDWTGQLIGYLKLPTRSTLRAVTRQKAWVVQRDSLDVPSVVRYRINWRNR